MFIVGNKIWAPISIGLGIWGLSKNLFGNPYTATKPNQSLYRKQEGVSEKFLTTIQFRLASFFSLDLWRMTTNVKAPRLLFHSMRAQDDFHCSPGAIHRFAQCAKSHITFNLS